MDKDRKPKLKIDLLNEFHRPGDGSRRVLHGFVLNLEGTRIPNAKVEALQPGMNKGEVYTDSSGYFVFFDLPIGTYEVTGSAKGYSSRAKKAKIRGNENIELIFELVEEVSRKDPMNF